MRNALECISLWVVHNHGKHILEIHTKNSTAFVVGNEVYVGTYGSTAFRATVAAVYDSALLLTDVFGSNGVNSAPALGSTLKGRTGGAGGSDTGATASLWCLSLCYRRCSTSSS